TREFYTYDISSNAWQRLADIPARKVKAGAGLACVNGTIYATIGGNKTEFYGYDMLLNAWTRLEDVPRDPDGYRVKVGGAMSSLEGTVTVLKGKRSSVILAYFPEEDVDQVGREPVDGAQARPVLTAGQVTVSPNPAGSRVRVGFGCSLAGSAEVNVYSSAGQLVQTAAATGSYVDLDVSNLVSGVYLLSVRNGNSSVTERLVIQH
ncbi:T9SS type A sorting domain-containing protein, partial [candidate division WOR-3 bacterium]|nr:T9SS type A sorting domain-containing protein [candidate division WOR-3 bacterium]